VRAALAAHDLRPRKRLGQTFLVDESVARATVEAAGPQPGDPVLEIGAGVGSLTVPLLEGGAEVWAVEVDRRLEPALQQVLEGAPRERLHLVWADFLELDLGEVLSPDRPWTIVGNLPYCITTPILERLFDFRWPVRRVVLMVQSEVATRLAAAPGSKDYGSLTVWRTWYAADISVVRRLKPGSFYPRPKVESSIVALTPRPEPPPVADEALLFAVVRGAFGQRRKTLLNALAGAPRLQADKRQLEAACQSCEIDPGRRGETLSFAEFVALADALYHRGQTGDSHPISPEREPDRDHIPHFSGEIG
jgi:16S rRNA (adenine1518-N6/adenine1519-N6)-dimethyltransferase